MPVRRMDELRADSDEQQDGRDLEQHHDVVGLGGFADAAHQDHCKEHDDEESRDIETKMPAGRVDALPWRSCRPGGQVCGRDPTRIGMYAEPVEQVDDVRGESDADAMLEKAYSRMRSQPMIQAISSPMVA